MSRVEQLAPPLAEHFFFKVSGTDLGFGRGLACCKNFATGVVQRHLAHCREVYVVHDNICCRDRSRHGREWRRRGVP
jgi:hypothetical protein